MSEHYRSGMNLHWTSYNCRQQKWQTKDRNWHSNQQDCSEIQIKGDLNHSLHQKVAYWGLKYLRATTEDRQSATHVSHKSDMDPWCNEMLSNSKHKSHSSETLTCCDSKMSLHGLQYVWKLANVNFLAKRNPDLENKVVTRLMKLPIGIKHKKLYWCWFEKFECHYSPWVPRFRISRMILPCKAVNCALR